MVVSPDSTALGLIDACIQRTVTLAPQCELVVLDGNLNHQRYTRLLH